MRTIARFAPLLVILVTACSGQVVIRQDFPSPLVAPLPYRVGIYFSPEFEQYVYADEESDLNFELGNVQMNLYRQVFGALFLQAVPVAAIEHQSDYELDLIIEPVLQEYAYLAPIETATDFYAVSLKYQIRLYSTEGDLIGYWPFVAYGKDRKQLIRNNESLGQATTVALRDAAAALVTQFREVVEQETWRKPAEESAA